MSGQGAPSRKSLTLSNSSSQGKKKALENGGADVGRKSFATSRSVYGSYDSLLSFRRYT